MAKFFQSYGWSKGVPKGLGLLEPAAIASLECCYKIVDDPYHKRYSVERYHQGTFHSVPYDSQMMDFRHLKPQQQQAWQKQTLESDDDQIVCLVRDQNDRLVFVETNLFDGPLCRECRVCSPQGLFLSVHRMYYSQLGDPFDGVVLYDRQNVPVMFKKYACSEEGVFTDLLEEQWDLTDTSALPV